MSAFMQDRAHFLAIMRTALQGPSDEREIRPDNVWYGPRWSAVSDADYAELLHWSEQSAVTRRLDWETAEEVTGVLYDENAASIRFRYADADESGMIDPVRPSFTGYEIRHDGRRLTAVDCLQAIRGLEYQSCEHPEWRSSEARRFLEALRSSLCNFISRGSDCWSISDRVSSI